MMTENRDSLVVGLKVLLALMVVLIMIVVVFALSSVKRPPHGGVVRATFDELDHCLWVEAQKDSLLVGDVKGRGQRVDETSNVTTLRFIYGERRPLMSGKWSGKNGIENLIGSYCGEEALADMQELVKVADEKKMPVITMPNADMAVIYDPVRMLDTSELIDTRDGKHKLWEDTDTFVFLFTEDVQFMLEPLTPAA